MMLAHDLARLLLSLPNLPVVSGLCRSGYGEPVESLEVLDAQPYAEGTDGFAEKTEEVIELRLSEDSSHQAPPIG